MEKRDVRGRRVWRIRKVIIGKRESEGGVVSVCRGWRRGFVHSLILFLAVLYEREISMALKLTSWFLWKLRSFIESIFQIEKGWWRKKCVWDYDTDIEVVKRENVTHLTSCFCLLREIFFRCKYPTRITK